MKQEATANGPEFEVVDSTLMRRVFYAFAALALLSAAISLGGKWLGRSIAMAGYTDDTTVHEVVIGNNVIAVPANFIRCDAVAPRPLFALSGDGRLQHRRA